MRTFLGALAAVTVLAATLLPAVSSEAAAPRVRVSAPGQAVEGERITVTALIGAPRKAKSVQFQYLDEDGVFAPQWKRLRVKKVAGKKARSVSVVANDNATMKFRAVVTYKGTRKKAISKPIVVRLLHWYSLTAFDPYFTSGTSIGSPYVSFSMNGRMWKGWYSRNGGEARYTFGRNCVRFKAQVGMKDDTADGSSGTVSLGTVDSSNTLTTIFTSPALAPGVLVPVDLPLARPYRFVVTGQSLTPELTTVLAMGDPSVLCHFPE